MANQELAAVVMDVGTNRELKIQNDAMYLIQNDPLLGERMSAIKLGETAQDIDALIGYLERMKIFLEGYERATE